MSKQWVMEVIEMDGELALDFPDELLKEMNWQIGDTLQWTQGDNGWILSKVEETNEQE